MIAYSITKNSGRDSMTVVVDSKVYSVASDHPNWKAIMDAINVNDSRLVVSLMDIPSTLTKWFRQGQVTVQNGEVFYGTRKLGGVVVDKIIEFIRLGHPVQPMLRFVEKLMSNPSHRAVEELYSFLEHKHMPITTDGNFVAYKGVQKDFYSITSGNITVIKGKVKDGRIFNGVGEDIEVRRNEVDDNKDNHCSKGIHAGSLEYATSFGSGGRVVLVEINPKDVVSIPSDCECQKLRTCAYKVTGEYTVPLDSVYIATRDEEPEWVGGDFDTDEDDNCQCEDCIAQREDEDSDYNDGYESGVGDGGVNYPVETTFNRIAKMPRRNRSQWELGYYDGFESTL